MCIPNISSLHTFSSETVIAHNTAITSFIPSIKETLISAASTFIDRSILQRRHDLSTNSLHCFIWLVQNEVAFVSAERHVSSSSPGFSLNDRCLSVCNSQRTQRALKGGAFRRLRQFLVLTRVHWPTDIAKDRLYCAFSWPLAKALEFASVSLKKTKCTFLIKLT